MSRKTSPARRAAFLQAVRETGNQTIAAERAKVSSSWVQLHRSIDPQFKADVAAAVEEAKAHFDTLSANGQGTRKPPSGWGHLDGEELVVKGTNGRRVQIARARLKQWTPRVETRFLETLAATCNVKLACAAVGLTVPSAYAHRKRWPAFAERWDEAILAGYKRIDLGMTEAAIALLDPHRFEDFGVPPPDAPVVAPITLSDAIRLVRLHEKRAREAAWRRLGRERGPAWPGMRR